MMAVQQCQVKDLVAGDMASLVLQSKDEGRIKGTYIQGEIRSNEKLEHTESHELVFWGLGLVVIRSDWPAERTLIW